MKTYKKNKPQLAPCADLQVMLDHEVQKYNYALWDNFYLRARDSAVKIVWNRIVNKFAVL